MVTLQMTCRFSCVKTEFDYFDRTTGEDTKNTPVP